MWSLLFKSLCGGETTMQCYASWGLQTSRTSLKHFSGARTSSGGLAQCATASLVVFFFRIFNFSGMFCAARFRPMSLSAAKGIQAHCYHFATKRKIMWKWRWSMMKSGLTKSCTSMFNWAKTIHKFQQFTVLGRDLVTFNRTERQGIWRPRNWRIHWSRQKDPDPSFAYDSFATVRVPNATWVLDIDRESLKSPGKLRLAFVYSLRDVFQFQKSKSSVSIASMVSDVSISAISHRDNQKRLAEGQEEQGCRGTIMHRHGL